MGGFEAVGCGVGGGWEVVAVMMMCSKGRGWEEVRDESMSWLHGSRRAALRCVAFVCV